ncbi:MAG TPA: hypothetical protein VFN09_05265 [Rhodanobacteraceae bacterium]|nr:hypothetical protein [Rhodanobacteraceae bacterium]
MKRISLKMKLLSLAILGLGGMAVAGSAAAACPTSPTPPWSGKNTLAGNIVIADGGYDSTSCRLDAKITGNVGSAAALVRDDSPASEPSYRAQFLVNLDNLASLNSTQPVRLFAATTDAPFGGVPELASISVYGNATGSTKILGISAACASGANNRCNSSFTLSGTGVQRIEVALSKSATGSLKVWVNNGTEASPDATINVDNSAWGGVDTAFLGLASPSVQFRAHQLNKVVGFDQFDSRRTTFIGTP